MVRKGTSRMRRTSSAAMSVPGDRVLRYAAAVYAVGFVLHNADHVRRGAGGLTREVVWAGIASGVLTVAAIAVAVIGHRLAPLIAVVTGFPAALGVTVVHLLPHWSALSDAFPGASVSALSWAAVLLEITGALVFGAAGVYVLRRGQVGERAAGPQRLQIAGVGPSS